MKIVFDFTKSSSAGVHLMPMVMGEGGPMKRSIAIGFLFLAGAASAGERKIARNEVPKPVLATLEKRFPAARQLAFEREVEKGKVVFEAQLLDGSRRLDVDVAPDGRLLAVEETIKLDAAPEAVRKGLAGSKYAKLPVVKTEKVMEYKNETVTATSFELVLGTGEKRMEVVFSESGKILKEEAKDEDDD
jgi:hypothetical protein